MLGVFKNTLLEPQKQFIPFKGKRTRWEQVFRERTTRPACLLVILVRPLRHHCVYRVSCSPVMCPVVSPAPSWVAFPLQRCYIRWVLLIYGCLCFCTLSFCFLPPALCSHIPHFQSWDLPPPQWFVFHGVQLRLQPTSNCCHLFFFIFCLYLELCSTTTCLNLDKGGDHTVILSRDASQLH